MHNTLHIMEDLMLTIKTHGTAFERGRQQGSICKEKIFLWLDRNMEEFRLFSDTSEKKKLITIVQKQMEKLYPEGYEEICGIADGIGMPEKDYISIMLSINRCSQDKKCTVLGFKSNNKKVIIGKTDDVLLEEIGLNVLEATYPKEGYKHIHFHFAGTIWSVAGMNECGLTFSMTGIPGPVTFEGGINSLDALHRILPYCSSVDDTIIYLRNLQLNSGGFSLLLGDSKGMINLIEITGAGLMEIYPIEGKFFLHTNHILDNTFQKINPSQWEPLLSNSKRRYLNALKKFKNISLNEQGMMSFLNDRSKDGAICQNGEDGLYTDFSVILLPDEKKVTYWTYDQGKGNVNTIIC